MSKFVKHSTKQKIVVLVIILFVLTATALVCYYIFGLQIKKSYDLKITQLQNEIDSNQKTAYVAMKDIAYGEMISTENVKLSIISSSANQSLYISKDQLGSIAVIDIAADMPIMSAMVSSNEQYIDLRVADYDMIDFKSFSMNDCVDIRICYPNGENYIILAKKNLKNISEDRLTSQLWLSEEEIQLMSSAIVDAYLYEGSTIYATKYIDSALQECSESTYVPSIASIDVIEQSPNIVAVASKHLSDILRKQLENRQSSFLNTNVDSIDWNVSNESSNVSSAETSSSSNDDAIYYSDEEESKIFTPDAG